MNSSHEISYTKPVTPRRRGSAGPVQPDGVASSEWPSVLLRLPALEIKPLEDRSAPTQRKEALSADIARADDGAARKDSNASPLPTYRRHRTQTYKQLAALKNKLMIAGAAVGIIVLALIFLRSNNESTAPPGDAALPWNNQLGQQASPAESGSTQKNKMWRIEPRENNQATQRLWDSRVQRTPDIGPTETDTAGVNSFGQADGSGYRHPGPAAKNGPIRQGLSGWPRSPPGSAGSTRNDSQRYRYQPGRAYQEEHYPRVDRQPSPLPHGQDPRPQLKPPLLPNNTSAGRTRGDGYTHTHTFAGYRGVKRLSLPVTVGPVDKHGKTTGKHPSHPTQVTQPGVARLGNPQKFPLR